MVQNRDMLNVFSRDPHKSKGAGCGYEGYWITIQNEMEVMAPFSINVS